MWEPFPTDPDPVGGEQVEEALARDRAPRFTSCARELSRMAQQAEWLSEMWSEFPAVAACHRNYARLFRAASIHRERYTGGEMADRRTEMEARRLAWRSYRQAVHPPPSWSPARQQLTAQRLKVDAYWSRQLWQLLDGDPVRLSILWARDYELQQLCDSCSESAPIPVIRVSLSGSLAAFRSAARFFTVLLTRLLFRGRL